MSETREEWLDRVKSIGVSLQGFKPRTGVIGDKKVTVEKAEGSTVVHAEHSDGRVDAQVTPATHRFKAGVHRTGKRKGQVAEIAPMSRKEKEQRYADPRTT